MSKRPSREGFHGLSPGVIVQQLAPKLPDGFVAEPRVNLGSFYEFDVCTFEQGEGESAFGASRFPSVDITTATQASPPPTLTLDAQFLEQYAYEVLIFDVACEREWVAAIEIVSPASKDRSESRQSLVTKCFNLLRNDVCASIVDLVTIQQFKLFHLP